MAVKPESHEQYLNSVTGPRKSQADEVKALLDELLPDAERVISYNMPAYKHEAVVIGFLANKNFVSIYPFSGQVLGELADELTGYSRTKSALHLKNDEPLPVALIKKIIATRRAEIARLNK